MKGSLSQEVRHKTNIIFAAILVLAAFIPYIPALRAGFVDWDDDVYVTRNENVLKGITPKTAEWAFSNSYSGFYYPITLLSHMLDVSIYGLRPWGHHLTNIMIHVLNTLLLFLFMKKSLLEDAKSFIVSALFAAHPLNVESVAWVSERKNLLAALFFFLAVNLYFSYTDKPSPAGYAKFFSAYALGLLSKSIVVALPPSLCLLDMWPLKRVGFSRKTFLTGIRRVLLEKVPLFLLVPVFVYFTVMAQKQMGSLAGLKKYPLGDRLAGAVIAWGSYIFKFLFPFKLSAFNPHLRGNYSVLTLGLSLAALSLFFIASLMCYKKKSLYLVSFSWFIANILPVSGIIQVGNQGSADRYMYIPMVGLLVALVFGVEDLFGIFRLSSQKAFYLLFSAVFIIFSAKSWFQAGVWKNNETLFTNMVTASSNPSQGYTNFGRQYKNNGDFSKAISYYENAINADPSNAEAYTNLGDALCEMKDYKAADEAFRKAWELNPDHPVVAGNYAFSREMAGDLPRAVELYRKAISLDKTYKPSRLRLAILLHDQKRPDEALRICEEGDAVSGDDPDYSRLKCSILLLNSRNAEAKDESEKALKRFPGDPSLVYTYNEACRRLQ